MNVKRYLSVFIVVISCFYRTYGQDVTLYQQFNGRYDFTFIGNTMNIAENNTTTNSVTLTSSTATLNLSPTDVVEKAYLYWAGSGDGDFEVNINSDTITPDRTFSYTKIVQGFEFTYFSAFKDVTDIIQNTGNGDYTLSDLDIAAFDAWHQHIRTNFAGWGIIIIYKNNSLPLNQINIYDGLQGVPDDLIINLNSLNVLDNNNAKVGFIAWEGDASLATESFYFNNHLLSNPPLNPDNNVFNSTNTITGSNTLYNMDLDVYDLQNFIHIGDATAQIKLTSTQDFIMINAVVTKLNNQLPDASIALNSIEKQCDSKTITIHYTVSNLNCTNPLPSGTPISIYVDGQLLQTFTTTVEIPIDGSISGQISVTLPDTILTNFDIKLGVDDTGNGTGIVPELIETNNVSQTLTDYLIFSPKFNALLPLISCNEGFHTATFNFSSYEELVKQNPADTVAFFETYANASNNTNAILNSSNFVTTFSPKEIFVRITNEHCYSITSFSLQIKNCPPTVYNYISANNDNHNDTFTIAGLRDIFLNYKLEIYSRWGRLLWTGSQNTEDWDGYVKDGLGSIKAPDGTYFYLLFLNDIDYPEPLKGFLYLNH